MNLRVASNYKSVMDGRARYCAVVVAPVVVAMADATVEVTSDEEADPVGTIEGAIAASIRMVLVEVEVRPAWSVATY